MHQVDVLRIRKGATLNDINARFLAENCTPLESLGLWVFEGAFEMFEHSELAPMERVAWGLVVPPLGGLTEEEILAILQQAGL